MSCLCSKTTTPILLMKLSHKKLTLKNLELRPFGSRRTSMYLSLENEISTQSYFQVNPEKKSKFIEAIFEIFIADQCICLINKNGNCTAAKKFSSKKIVTETINFSQRRQSSAKKSACNLSSGHKPRRGREGGENLSCFLRPCVAKSIG